MVAVVAFQIQCTYRTHWGLVCVSNSQSRHHHRQALSHTPILPNPGAEGGGDKLTCSQHNVCEHSVHQSLACKEPKSQKNNEHAPTRNQRGQINCRQPKTPPTQRLCRLCPSPAINYPLVLFLTLHGPDSGCDSRREHHHHLPPLSSYRPGPDTHTTRTFMQRYVRH